MFCETQDSFSPLWMDLLNSYISYINLAFIYTIYMFLLTSLPVGFSIPQVIFTIIFIRVLKSTGFIQK